MTESSFERRECEPCRGGIPPMSEAEAQAALAEVPGWSLTPSATRLQRRFTFPDFASAKTFVDRVSELAEAQGHHPEITFGWGYVELGVWTHKINGLHDNDFIFAAKVNALYAPEPTAG